MTTADKYELPVYCAKDAHEIAKVFGIPVSSVWDCMRNERTYKNKFKFFKVDIDEDDEE